MNYILEYWNAIQTGTITVSKRVKKIYQKLAEDLNASDSEYTFDEARACRPIGFIEQFTRHSKVNGLVSR